MRFLLILLTAFSISCSFQPGQVQAKQLFKIASLAPEGSVWITQFDEFAKEVEAKTGGEVTFRVYAGGIMGDDTAMYRKMRVGQLHGGGFTMTGIAPIVPDFRIMSIPFLFNNYEEVDAVSEALEEVFIEQFRKKGMEFIARTEVGFVYTMSTAPITTTEEMKNSTPWIPAGDPLAATFIETVGVTPIQLSIPDVLSSLQTGMINTVFNSLYGSIVMQWFTKATNVTDNPFGYAYGAFLLDKKRFDRLSPAHKKIIHEAADHHFSILIDETRKSNADSYDLLKQQGVKFVKADEASLKVLSSYRQQTVERTIGKDYSKKTYESMMQSLEKYRAAESK